MDGNEQVCSGVEIEGEAVCETHDHSNCLDCNHTAPGPREITVMEAKVENNVPGVRMDSTCNHSSPRTEGIQNFNFNNSPGSEWIVPDNEVADSDIEASIGRNYNHTSRSPGTTGMDSSTTSPEPCPAFGGPCAKKSLEAPEIG